MILFPKPVSIKKTPKPINKVSTKKKVRLKSMWSETELFEKRYKQLKKMWLNKCFITWVYLTLEQTSPASYAHILSKWMYPHLRYYLNNIALVKWIDEHHLLDTEVNRIKKEYGEKYLEQFILDWKEIIILL